MTKIMDGPEPHAGVTGETGAAPEQGTGRAEPRGENADPAERDGSVPRVTVVGIGASAGGLEALQRFVAEVQPDAPLGYVVITHQHPAQASRLTEILAKSASVPVEVISDGARVERGHVYVAPPGVSVSIEQRVLRVAPPLGDRANRLPVDSFFRSLARDQGEDAVAVVLSGTGSDGTLGLAEIKIAGGVVLAQDASSALYAGMPGSAASTHLVDLVLPPEEMPKQLARLLARRHGAEPLESVEDAYTGLERVLAILRSRTGHDFTLYKKSTLNRRLERRMNIRGVHSLRDYARLLERTPNEVDTLFREILISVTSFFRNPETFDALVPELRQLLAARDESQPFRAWVPACATGEEAYSLAMLVCEILQEISKKVPVQIFATDLDQQAIDVARAGRYAPGIAADVSSERLRRFFMAEQSGFRVCKEVRQLLVFAGHNLIKDPPFTKLDLVSCRNLLIYLEPDLQRRVLRLFGYSLRSRGVLLLGSSESVSGFDDVFTPIDKKAKLFKRRDTRGDGPEEFPELRARLPARSGAAPRPSSPRPPTAVAFVADRVLLANFAPPSVVINEHGEIFYFHGRTGQFLEPAAGEPSANLFAMVREGLRLELPGALRQASSGVDVVVRPGLQVKNNGGFISVRLIVRRLEEPEPVRGMFLVSFEVEPDAPPRERLAEGSDPASSDRLAQLELELLHTRESLQGTIEELETSNEELKSTNEELQSTNEELQSANEELETSREEMQSLNEELQTVNSELEERNRTLLQTNDDMQSLLNSTDVAIVFLDEHLAIKRFTTQARKVFSLIDTDIGRPIADLSANLRYDALVEDARAVLRSLAPQEREIQTKEGSWRLMRIMPYRTTETLIAGLVMTFVDIDRGKREQLAASEARKFVESLIDALPVAVITLDTDRRIKSANGTAFEMFQTSAKRVVGEPLSSIADGLLDSTELSDCLSRAFAEGVSFQRLSVIGDRRRLGTQELLVAARRVDTAVDEPVVVVTIDEIRLGTAALRRDEETA